MKNKAGFGLFLAAYAGLFALFRALLSASELIIVLNGLFIGAIASLVVAFSPLTFSAVAGRLKYADVAQMTLGAALMWIGVTISVLVSIFLQASGALTYDLTLTALARYTVIAGALMIVYAPDFGFGVFHGRDRKVAVVAMLVGLAVAACVVCMQRWELLS